LANWLSQRLSRAGDIHLYDEGIQILLLEMILWYEDDGEMKFLVIIHLYDEDELHLLLQNLIALIETNLV